MRFLLYVCAVVGAVVLALMIAGSLNVGYFVLYYGMDPAVCVSPDEPADAHNHALRRPNRTGV